MGNVTKTDKMFSNCTGLTTLYLPLNLTALGAAALFKCDNLAEVYCLCDEVPSVEEQGFDPWNTTLYVLLDHKYDFETAPFWQDFRDVVEVSSEVGVANLSNDKTQSIDVFDMNGRCLHHEAEGLDYKKLPRGIYIVNGRKVMIP
jgi:hypothetical protein